MTKGKIVIIAVLIYAIGFALGWITMCKTMSTEEIAQCEQIAREACYQKEIAIVEAPQNVSVERTEQLVVVRMKGHRDSINAQLQNGEIVVERDDGIASAIFESAVVGIVILGATVGATMAALVIIAEIAGRKG